MIAVEKELMILGPGFLVEGSQNREPNKHGNGLGKLMRKTQDPAKSELKAASLGSFLVPEPCLLLMLDGARKHLATGLRKPGQCSAQVWGGGSAADGSSKSKPVSVCLQLERRHGANASKTERIGAGGSQAR